ncbi:hypothetical protein [Gordonibacter sp.]|uniref:hypothetical protein n=2 Tax=Gordonibacter sp. TaxID=1968902 RepID=UPI002FC9F731
MANKKYKVTVEINPGFCGVDVGGIQFANGEAEVADTRLISWFEEHDGYAVEEIGAKKTPKELLADEAAALGIDVPGKATAVEIEALIAAAKSGNNGE